MTDLRAKEFFVEPDIGKAESLNASAFVDPDFLELELDRVFSGCWTIVRPRAGNDAGRPPDLLSKPGSRTPFSVLGKPLFLQLNSLGELNCFPNVCTHAWHPLVETPSIGDSIVCPQHGRRFDNDGKFVSHKGFENLKDFPRECDSLRKLKVENWGPFTFLCLGDPLGPFGEFVDNVQKSIPGIDLAKLRYHTVPDEIREVDGTWKQHAWNYMDNYHIRFVHKGPGRLAVAIDLNSYQTELYKLVLSNGPILENRNTDSRIK